MRYKCDEIQNFRINDIYYKGDKILEKTNGLHSTAFNTRKFQPMV